MNKKIKVLGVPLTAIIIASIIATVLLSMSPTGKWHDIIQPAFAVGTMPDGYGNRIETFSVIQWIAGAWYPSYYVDYTAYSSGATVGISSAVSTWFSFYALMNKTQFNDWTLITGLSQGWFTLAGVAYAATGYYTGTSITIGGQGYWVLQFIWNNGGAYWVPAASTTYSLVVTFKVYY